jgi:hypothetical protein
MRAKVTTGCLAMVLMGGLGGEAVAQSAAAPQSPAPALDPQALAALNQMGAFLRQQRTLAVRAETTTDEVLASGQKIQLGSTVDLRVRRPNRLRADVESDRKSRRFYYDGKMFTMFGPRAGYYATMAAPATINDLVEVAAQRYGLEFPLVDLFYWGTPRSGAKSIRAASSLGRSTVNGIPCDHYAFRQADVDWQIWIEHTTSPLPRKLLITSINEPGQPQHTVEMAWTLSPLLEDQLFKFAPPAEAQRIEFTPADAARLRVGRQAPPAPRKEGKP